MILAKKTDHGFDAVTVGQVGVYPCAGARDDALAVRIADLLADQSRLSECRIRMETTDGLPRIELAA